LFSCASIPSLNALDNVALPMMFQDIEKDEREEKSLELLKLVDLSDRADHLPNQLSGGQQQRVAIARALSVNPEIILADEPTGNLDSKTGQFIMDFLSKIQNDEGKTIIIVTHDLNLVKNASVSFLSFSMPSPPLPISRPGRAVFIIKLRLRPKLKGFIGIKPASFLLALARQQKLLITMLLPRLIKQRPTSTFIPLMSVMRPNLELATVMAPINYSGEFGITISPLTFPFT